MINRIFPANRILGVLILLLPLAAVNSQSFNSTGLTGESLLNPTSLDFGPDGRLYVSQQDGTILAYTVSRNGASPGNGIYSVSATETINHIKTGIPNHNDDGTSNSLNLRQVTGLVVSGTASVPILYVSSSDSRIGGGASGNNTNLDTNSGVLSRLTKNGNGWTRVDLVRGLPRCEENHSTNGMTLLQKGGSTYLLVQQGGNTNMGAPSNNFTGTSETFLSAALLIFNLTQLQAMPVYTDPRSNTSFVYDLPTLNDPERANITNSHPQFPYPAGHPLRNATIDLGDPFGGNNGLNQAFSEPGGPVQIFSPGFRNAYDVVVTASGKIYTSDNGPNSTWGGKPLIYTSSGALKSTQTSYNPANGEFVKNTLNEANSSTIGDGLHYIGATTDANGTYYGGHPVPIRAFPSRAGVINYKYNGSQWFVDSSHNFGTLLSGVSGYFNSSFNINSFPDDSRQGEYLVGAASSSKVRILDMLGSSTNGICEYTASNFSNAMKGNLLTVSFTSGGSVNRYQLNTSGTGLTSKTNAFLSGFGGQPLDIIAQGDTEPFPGTIWVATYGSNNIIVFEPADFSNCLQPGQAGYSASADYDGDGFTNGDEIANGTNHCSGGSKPPDNDGDFISDLTDTDDDNDGIPDKLDAFAIDRLNGNGTNLPVSYPFWNNDPGTGFFGLGFTGLMLNPAGTTDYLTQFSESNLSFGGAGGKATIDAVDGGTAQGTTNTQKNGFQFGVNVNNSSPPFTIHTRLENPFGTQEAGSGRSQGIFIGNGDQNNYLKIVVMQGTVSGDGLDGLQILAENGGSVSTNTFNIPNLLTANAVDLFISVNPASNNAQMYYSLNGGSTKLAVGSAISLPTSLLSPSDNKGMAVGLISTTGGGSPFTATWDFINVTDDNSVNLVRINAGGPQLTHNGTLFSADQYFSGGKTFTNSSAQVPVLYQTERSASPPTFTYNIPANNGNYTVVLHFADIYWGATGGGPGGTGKRIFDVTLEGVLVLNNYDINADVGPETVVTKTFNTTIADGAITIYFSALSGDGGVDQPKVSAIEVYTNTAQYPPVTINPIASKVSAPGENVSFSAVASGGNPQASFTYSISGQPQGVGINSSTGLISGTIAANAASGGPGGNGNYSVTVTASKNGSAPASTGFSWSVSSGWTDKNENENYTARHECSFVQAGNRFYLMGGRENATTIDVYNYSANSWTSLVNSSPVEFNHYQATEYQGLIWVIGAFKTNAFPNESPADNIYAFDPAANVWFQGPAIPAARRRGSAGLVVYNDKFYIVGGNTLGHNGGYVNWFDVYDPATGIWTTLPNAPRARDHFHAAVIGTKLYAAGGRLSGGTGGTFKPVIPQVDVYDFSTGNWSTLPASQNLPTPRAAATVANFNGKLLVIGGEVENEPVYGSNVNDALKITEAFDPANGTWARLPDLNYKRHGTQAIVSGNGVFVTAGSPNKGGGNQKNMEFLGADAAVGTASVSSTLTGPTSMQVAPGSPGTITLGAANGTVGIFVKSTQLTGTNASEFSIISGTLTNSLIKTNSSRTLQVAFNGSQSGRTANLVISYGQSGQKVIALQSTTGTPSSGVTSLTLVNASSDTDILTLQNNQQISSGIVGGIPLNVRANTNPATVGSVVFVLSGPVNHNQTENLALYALFGNNGNDYHGQLLPNGNYTLNATAYSASGGGGTNLGSLNISFSIVSQGNQPPVAVVSATPSSGTAPLNVNFTGSNSTDDSGISSYSWNFGDGTPSSSLANPSHTFSSVGSFNVVLTVTDVGGLQDTESIDINVTNPQQNGIANFTLVDAGTNSDLFALSNNQQISSSLVQGKNLNIRANTNPATVGSVSIALSGPVNHSQTENTGPYALFGDSAGNYNGVPFPQGNYTISATAFSARNLAGTNLGSLTVNFSVGSAAARESQQPEATFILLYPNPTQTISEVETKNLSSDIQQVLLFDVTGRLVRKYNGTQLKTGVANYQIDVGDMEEGIYFVKFVTQDAHSYYRQLVVKKR